MSLANGNVGRAADDNTQALRQSKFELAVALTLFTWPDLTLAVQNQWGGPDSAEKREWFAGAVVDLFPSPSGPPTDRPELEDVESRLLQIMEDEFEVVVDDDSSLEVAQQIMNMWEQCMQGDFKGVDQLQQDYSARGSRADTIRAAVVDDDDSIDDEEWDEEDGDDEDVEMGDAPPALVPKEKPAPEVDEDGFTKVVGRRRGK
ncbi:uncharacterized protein PV09_08968 [Verruconis gallopava]|uniref:Pre-rRNA-processing protein TSR2 n=1 Tax=Verruconis gallopava TaxID=253628 RepID=A0A0D1ZXW3_9PEZI|nr:uncharacterized protein PV09_08968 [Verruconis gallopava]KIV99307.1 hypothetical protein PV09_08968 [Verruconis gallopava]